VAQDGTKLVNPNRQRRGPIFGRGLVQTHVPLALPEGQEKGVYVVTVSAGGKAPLETMTVWLNGVPQILSQEQNGGTIVLTLRVPLTAKEPMAVISAVTPREPVISFTWETDEAPAP
jgi:hypothetical protein